MSRVLAEVAGKILTLLGYDGTDFRNVHVDADGDLQVDVLTTAFPAGIATEATLATRASEAKLELVRLLLLTLDGDIVGSNAYLLALLTELRLKADLTETQPVSAAALPLPAGASTQAQQVTQTIALQLIDNLVGALDSVGTDELDVNVEASVLPTGAATSAWQDTLNDGLVTVIDNLPTGGKQLKINRTANIANTTWTDLVTKTVPAGKIHYWTGIAAGLLASNDNWEIKLTVAAGDIFQSFVAANPFTLGIGVLSAIGAGVTYKIQVYHAIGAAKWMSGLMTYIEVNA